MANVAYRPEVDGLRALAILPVVVYHMHLGWLEGGFVGVDVFFVISGYLITSILIREMTAGEFSILGFYERRARRILPALFVVTLVATPFAYTVLLPYQVVGYSESLISTLFFFSNFLFMFESGYFNSESALKPLLHTWSLAVEEQFYIVFPLFLLATWRFGVRLVLGIMAIVFVVSLVGAEMAAGLSASMNFFFTPSRAFELLAGCFAAFALVNGPLKKGILGEVLALIGLGAVLLSYVVLGDWGNVPGFATLVPVLGATAIILFAEPDTIVGRVLSNRILVFVGLISYSLYLWHWPIFVYARIINGSAPGPILALGLALLSVGAAYLNWRFVERPFRRKDQPSRRWIFAWSAAAGSALAGLALFGIIERGFLERYAPEDQPLAMMAPGSMGENTDLLFRSLENKPFDDDATTPNILVVGDSYAMDYMNMAAAIGEMERASYSTRHIHAVCGVVFTDRSVQEFIPSKQTAECNATMPVFNERVVEKAKNADRVVLASAWRPWVVDLLPETVEKLRAITDAEILVVGTKYFSEDSAVRDLLAMDRSKRQEFRSPIPDTRLAMNDQMRSFFETHEFVDIFAAICSDDGTCPVMSPEGELLSFDGTHLTPEGADFVGKALAAQITSETLTADVPADQ